MIEWWDGEVVEYIIYSKKNHLLKPCTIVLSSKNRERYAVDSQLTGIQVTSKTLSQLAKIVLVA